MVRGKYITNWRSPKVDHKSIDFVHFSVTLKSTLKSTLKLHSAALGSHLDMPINIYVSIFTIHPSSSFPYSALRGQITGKSSANVTHDLFLHVVGHVSVPLMPCTPGVCVTFALEFAVLTSRTHRVCTRVARGCGGGAHVRRAHGVCVTSALEGPLIMSHINRFWRRGRGPRRPRARTGRASRRHHRLQWFRHTQSGGAGRGGGVQV